MPMYSYRCRKCGRKFEELTAMDRRDQVRCPECGGETERAWDAPGVFGIDFSGGCKEKSCEFGGACGGCCNCGCH